MASNSNNEESKALKAGVGYTLGNILVKGITFVSIPLFARLLTVSDYGVVNTFSAYVSIFSIIIGFAMHTSIKNAKIDFAENVKEYISSLTIITWISLAVFLVISILFAIPLSEMLSLAPVILIPLLVVESFAMTMITYYNCVLSIDYRYKDYIFISVLYSVLGIGLSVLFIVTVADEKRWMGRILGVLISAVLVTVIIFSRIYEAAAPKINIIYWKYALKISLPIIPHGLSQIVLAQFDRLMINSVSGSVKAGLYSFSYNIGTIFQVVANSLDTAWTQWFFDQMTKKDYVSIKKIAVIYQLVVSMGAASLMLVSPELIILMGGKKYVDSIAVAFPVVLAMYYSYVYYFPASVEYYYKKTNYIAVGTMIAAVVNIILNWLFIPKYGYVAAAYTTVFCYFIYYIFHVLLSKKVHGSIIYDMKKQIGMIIVVTCIMCVGLFFKDNVFVRYGILVLEITAVIIFGLNHKEIVRDIINRFR